jgi:hypothetical protein
LLLIDRRHEVGTLQLPERGFGESLAPPQPPARNGMAPEDGELADALDVMERPPAVTVFQVQRNARDEGFIEWLKDPRNRRQIPHRFATAGYVAVRNSAAKDGLWKISGKRQAVYAKEELSERERFAAAAALGRR